MKLYSWQEKAISIIQGQSALLSAPTGSGKTIVAYIWAGLYPSFSEGQRVIFTAPIKALSNERYLSLREMDIPVGIETGDFKKNIDAPVLCVTQEIYTLKYAQIPNQKVVIDEFHYIYADTNRARAYIDGIVNTHPSTELLIMSATLGKIETLQQYLSHIANRSFVSFETDERATELIFLKKETPLHEIKNSLVFIFSARGVIEMAEEIAYSRDGYTLTPKQEKRIQELSRIFSVSLPEFYDIISRGIGVYYGSMLPKEKLFMEMLYREGIIDVMVGTDSLSLGVNLPAEKVIFAQLAKYYQGPITKIEFLQMAGRAGRKGYYDTGYVSYYRSSYEAFEYDTESLYFKLLEKEPESMQIYISPDYKKLLGEQTTPEKEAQYISSVSFPALDRWEVQEEIEGELEYIDEKIQNFANLIAETEEEIDELYQKIKTILAQVYFSELNSHTNIILAKLFAIEKQISSKEIFEVIASQARNEFFALLQAKKFIKMLPEVFKKKVKNKNWIEKQIYRIDDSVYLFEEKINKAKRRKS